MKSSSEKKHVVQQDKPLARYRVVAVLSAAFLFVAFLLLLLVALSLPIIKPIYLFALKSTTDITAQPLSLATELRFGVWGVCAASDLNPKAALCLGPKLGYTLPPALAAAIGLPTSLLGIVEKALLVVLVLHPIAAALALLTVFFSLFLTSHAAAILALVLAIVLGLLASVSLAVDIAVVLLARGQLGRLQGLGLRFEVRWGNAVWMSVGAVAAVWAAVAMLSARACYCCGQRRVPRYEEHELKQEHRGNEDHGRDETRERPEHEHRAAHSQDGHAV